MENGHHDINRRGPNGNAYSNPAYDNPVSVNHDHGDCVKNDKLGHTKNAEENPGGNHDQPVYEDINQNGSIAP